MKTQLSKIVLFLVTAGLLTACDAVKRVADDEHLLTEATVTVNDKPDKTERINSILLQRPNSKIPFLDFPLKLHFYNLARPNIDSIVNAKLDKRPKKRERLEKFLSRKQLDRWVQSRINFNTWWKKKGEAPVIFDKLLTEKSATRLKAYYFNNGWFNADVDYEVEKHDNKRAEVVYKVNTGTPYKLDSITPVIATPALDSLYHAQIEQSYLKRNEQYKSENTTLERQRITEQFRNSGVYHFGQDYVTFDIDTVGTKHKVNTEVKIPNRSVKNLDSTRTEPFKIYTIKDVNIYTDYSFEGRESTVTDSVEYKGYKLYSFGKMRYRPKAITDALFISPKTVFSDLARTRSYRHLSELQTFKYPDIEYVENPDTTLTTNVYLSPKKRFELGLDVEASRSNIQQIGLSANPSLLIRNIFRGAETLQITARGAIGASEDVANRNDRFFDIIEYGVDFRLTIPRLFFPIKTEKVIPKYMLPSTRMTLSTSSQTNIGLDKQTFTGALNYHWRPSQTVTNSFDLFNIRFIENENVKNYFGVYQSSYGTLNNIAHDINYIPESENLGYPNGANNFIDEVLSDSPPGGITEEQIRSVNSISERKNRLTDNNLIFSSIFNYTKNKQENLLDNNFSILRLKLETSGNLLSAFSRLTGQEKDANGQYKMFNVAFSQFVKTELDYIKHWDLGRSGVLAFRGFFGIAIPYGNATNIPFVKSFFAGGANDNRAWSPYALGPGSSRTINEFNEANMKLAFSLETRFNMFGPVNGALFIDAGNIWNALDDVTDPRATFTNLRSLNEMAIGSGFGIRYDLSLVVVRFDIGFKTYEPYLTHNQNGWFNNYNFANAVYNIGINYPF